MLSAEISSLILPHTTPAIGQQEINCADIEFVTLNPPSGLTCAQYMDPYISFAGGYLTNPNAMSGCLYLDKLVDGSETEDVCLDFLYFRFHLVFPYSYREHFYGFQEMNALLVRRNELFLRFTFHVSRRLF